jgi:hypothetical protein
MTSWPYNNGTPQAERRQVLENDRKASTYFAHAQADAELDLGGRFKAVHTTTFTGADPTVAVPQQPLGSHWHCDPCGQEPPLGYRVDDFEPTGEKFEVAASMAGDAAGSPPSPAASGDVGGVGGKFLPPKLATQPFRRRV